MLSCIKNRLAAMQLCPAFCIRALIAVATATSKSASSRTIYALLPPNSNTHFFKWVPAIAATAFPADSLPVKETP